jgi:hypothetical protein
MVVSMSAQNGILKIPVICPQCGGESLLGLPWGETAADLVSGRHIELQSSCHARSWIASPTEVEQMRQYCLSTLA